MNLTGDLPAAVQQFSAQLPALLKSLTDAGLTTEADLVQGLHATVSDAVSQAQDAIAIDLRPVVEESRHWRSILSHGFQGSIGGMPFSLKAMVSGDPSIADPNADPSQATPALSQG